MLCFRAVFFSCIVGTTLANAVHAEGIDCTEIKNKSQRSQCYEKAYKNQKVKASTEVVYANLVEIGKRNATKDFFDPESARFRDLKIMKTPKGYFQLCGEVNGKNRNGGYVGYQRFVSGTGENDPDKASTVTIYKPKRGKDALEDSLADLNNLVIEFLCKTEYIVWQQEEM